MISYRFRRRAFMTALSGGVGLKIMLRTLEGSAVGTRSPGRLLVTHWPVGIVAGSSDALWRPTSGSVGGSPGLKPFADAGLGPDMTVIKGVSTTHLNFSGSGGSEGGTVTMVTGVAPLGTRAGQPEADDAIAAGPSFDQLLLKNVAGLQRPGPGFVNSIADSRTDFGEIAPKCLSYANELQDVNAVQGTLREAVPLQPVLSPLMQYVNLFGGMLPGSGGAGGQAGIGGAAGAAGSGGRGQGGSGVTSPPVADAMLKKLVAKRSVLDFAVQELNRLKTLAPSEARSKLTIHTDAVLNAEASVISAINARYPNPSSGGAGGRAGGAGGQAGGAGGQAGIGGTAGSAGQTGGNGDPTCGGTCQTKPPIPPGITGMADPPRGFGNSYGNPRAMQDDAPLHQQVGNLHLNVLRAAFVCDLVRVGTYQWSPGTNHVGFALMPNDPQPFQHHPQSHRIGTADTMAASTVSALNSTAVFLFNVQVWYFSRHAENFASWKNSVDGCGNNLLDFTCVPFVTEVRATGHERSSLPAMIIGGRQLGFAHGRYVNQNMTVNELWGTIAQAFTAAPLGGPFGTPVPGFWAAP